MSTYALGSLYSAQKRDVKKAIVWYKKAVKLGHMVSAHNLGTEYYRKREYKEAIKWFRLAYKKGRLYKSAVAIAKISTENLKMGEKSLDIYKQVGDDGYTQAYNLIGLAYVLKFKDIEKAIYWYKQALDLVLQMVLLVWL